MVEILSLSLFTVCDIAKAVDAVPNTIQIVMELKELINKNDVPLELLRSKQLRIETKCEIIANLVHEQVKIDLLNAILDGANNHSEQLI